MITLSSYLIWQIISFILPSNEYGCVNAWTTLGSGPAIDLQKMTILAKKNHIFRWSSFWSWRVCKQAKLSSLELRKLTRIHWKVVVPKTSHCLVQILVQSQLSHKNKIVGYVNKQNCRIWGTENQHAPKTRGIIGPLFFENEQGEALTVNGDRYRAMFNEFLFE